MKLQAKKLSKTASLKCMLQWGHAAQIVASEFRERLSEDGGGPLCNVWLANDVEEKRALVSRMAVTNACEVEEYGARSIAIKRFGISGFPFVTKPPNAATGRGGRGPSLVGYADLSHPELSFLTAIEDSADSLHAANSQDGAAGLLKRLSKPDIKGGGGLVSERTLTHIEPTGMVDGVLKPYQGGGAGTRKAWLFVVTLVEFILQTTGLTYTAAGVLEALKTTLEKTVDGQTSLARRMRKVASECEALHGLEDCASFMANTALMGGSLETPNCDGIWRLYRPLVLGCEKPRVKLWNPETSGGNPLTYYPRWDLVSGTRTIYRLRDFLLHFYEYRQGCRENKPTLSAYAITDLG